MEEFNPQAIQRLVFDLNSLEFTQEGEWTNFQSFIRVLDNRSYTMLLIGENCMMEDWQNYSNVSLLVGETVKLLGQNLPLSESGSFWITDDQEVQKNLGGLLKAFAGGINETEKNGGLQYRAIYDLLEVFHPSRNTVLELANSIIELKHESPSKPLTLGIGGPDGCGHSFIIGELVDVLEERSQLVSGIDLTELLGIEFKHKNVPNRYWRSPWIREWVLEKIMIPFSRGVEVLIEKEPQALSSYEISTFPFFLAPEMVLLVWGSTLFLPEFCDLIDIRILLDLSDKAATARIFEIDERKDFDNSFIESYGKSEGSDYEEYLNNCKEAVHVDYHINYDNFHAFSMKKPNTS